MSTLYTYPPSNIPQSHDIRRSHDGRFDLDRNHGAVPTSRNSQGHVSMAPPPPRLPVPVDPSLQGVMSNPSTPFPNHVFPVAGTLVGDSARDSRGTSGIWLPNPLQSGNEATIPDPIARFYNSNVSSEPWNPQRVTGVVPPEPSPQGPNKRQRLYGHTLHYPSGTRSDYGVYPGFSRSDSEYSSSMDHTAQTAPNHNQAGSSESVPNGMDALPRMNGTTSSTDQTYQTAQPVYEPRTLSEDAQSQESSPGLQCERSDCDYVAKCQSEMKKHIARHEKPFKCLQPNCGRKDRGFSTINDLERHSKCVHHINPSHGFSKTYKCFGDNCSKKEKEWPRLDNFRQHLTRMHQSQDPEKLVKQSEKWYDTNAQRKRQQQVRFSQQSTPAPVGVIHRPGPRPEMPVTSQNGAMSRPAHPDQNQDYLPHKQRSSVSFALGGEGSSAISRTSSTSKATNPPTSHNVPGQDTPMQRQQTAQGIAQEFVGLPPQVNGNGPSNKPASVSQRTQYSSRSLPGENDSVMSEGVSSFPANSNLQKSAAWDRLDTARLTSFMTAAASLGEAELKILNSSSYQDLEAELAHLTGTNNTASHNASPAVPVSSSLNAKATHAPSLPSEFRIGFENLKTLGRLSNMMPKSRSVTAASDPGLLPHNGSRRGPSAPGASGSGGGSATGSKSESTRFKCPNCVKEFDKQCLLNKHLGRHNKIYSCTSSDCDKRFGSKNDWVRHEESQHPMATAWLCEVLDEQGRPCGEYFSSSGTGNLTGPSDHLRDVHRYDSDERIQASEAEWKMGRFGNGAFWCGFCQKRVVVKNDQLKPILNQRARFNHIETEHYKKGQRRGGWVAADKFAGHVRGHAGNYGPTDDDSVSSESSQGTRLSGDTLVQNPATLQSTDPAKAATATILQPTTIAPHQLRSDKIFHCCKCGDGPWNYSINPACAACQHHSCNYCNLETV